MRPVYSLDSEATTAATSGRCSTAVRGYVGIVGGFARDGMCDRVGDGAQFVHAFREAIAQHVRAELNVNQIHRDSRHGQQQHHRNHGDEHVSDNQPVAQAPHELPAHPGSQTEGEINQRENK